MLKNTVFNKFNSYFFAMLFLLFNCPVNAKNFDCENPLILSSTTDWYPYIYMSPEGVSMGADIELLRIILKEIGCELKVVHFPERRSLFELKKGNVDIGLGASFNKERAQAYWYSNQYRHEVNQFAYRTNDRNISESTNIKNIIESDKIIAINLAGWYGEEIEKAKADSNNFIYSDTVSKRLKMLNFERVDIVIDDSIVLCHELHRLPFPQITIHPSVLYDTPIYFLFNKKTVSKSFIDKFNKALEEMRISGLLKQHYIDNLHVTCSVN